MTACLFSDYDRAALPMKTRGNTDGQDLAEQIEALLEYGETLLWWDKLSDRSLIGGFGKTLTLFTLLVNAAILLLIFVPALLPETSSFGWLIIPLLIVDCICLLFILLYFAFGLMIGGVNAITDQRVIVADLHKNKIVRSMRLDSLSSIRVRHDRHDRGNITFFRDETGEARASSEYPRRLSLTGVRHFNRVMDLLRKQTDGFDDPDSGG